MNSESKMLNAFVAHSPGLPVFVRADENPGVRGDTISIFEPKPAPEANAPSPEDDQFLIACRKQYLRDGYILARDSHTYEAIAKRYPDYVFPRRLRGAEGRRWRALHEPDAVTGRIKPGKSLRGLR